MKGVTIVQIYVTSFVDEPLFAFVIFWEQKASIYFLYKFPSKWIR